MKRTILLTIAAAVATVPAVLGVTGNTTFSQSIPAPIPSGAWVLPSDDHRGRDAAATGSPAVSATGSETRGRGSDDATAASATSSDDHGHGSEGATSATDDDRQGRGSGDGATAASTRVTVMSATTASSTVDDRGRSADSSDQGDGSGTSGSGKQ
jgi:hypothetical protein